jgi:hypothetical protein
MTLRWRYEIHTKAVGTGSLERSGSVETVEEIAAIVKASYPQNDVRIMAPLDETGDERDKLATLNVERL